MRLRFQVIVLIAAAAAIALSACQKPAEPPSAQPVESAADRAAKVAEENKALFMRFMTEVGNNGNVDMMGEFIAPDFVEHQAMPPGLPAGAEGLAQMFAGFHEAFPDLSITVSEIVAEGDLVAARSTWTGTQAIEWMGMAPSGSPVTFEVIDIVRIKDGKAVEHWGLDNSAQMMMGAQSQ